MARHRPGAAPGAGPPKRSRARTGSIASHVGPLHQGELLPAEDRITQFVDGQSPPADLRLTHFTAAATSAAQHRDQRGHLFFGRVALEHPDVRPVWRWGVRRSAHLTHGSWIVRLVPVTHYVRSAHLTHRSWIVRLVPVTHYVRSAHLTHSGMFPCFFGGIWAILRSSSRSAVPM